MSTSAPEHQDNRDEAERLAKLFADPIAEIWLGIESGVTTAVEFFLPDYRAPDPHMAAAIVRYETELRLQRAMAEAQEQGETLDWYFRRHHNSGVEIVIGDWHLKSFKARDGGPPSPGHSFARREFWQQHYSPTLFNVGSEGGNLILYWRVGKSESIELNLCKPAGVWKYKGVPQTAWRQPISYDPVQGLRFVAGQHDDEELDIFRKSDEAAEEGEDEAGDG